MHILPVLGRHEVLFNALVSKWGCERATGAVPLHQRIVRQVAHRRNASQTPVGASSDKQSRVHADNGCMHSSTFISSDHIASYSSSYSNHPLEESRSKLQYFLGYVTTTKKGSQSNITDRLTKARGKQADRSERARSHREHEM